MKPRKIILLVDTSPINLSVRSFLLDVWGYRPIKARSAREAKQILDEAEEYSISLVLLADEIKLESKSCPIHRSSESIDMCELRGKIKSMTTRRRGPRSKTILKMKRAA